MMTNKFPYLRAVVMVLFAALSISMAAQTAVTGVVLEPDGIPAIGATVMEKGSTTNGTATDIDGNFSLQVSSAQATLVVSYVGMETQEVPLNGQTNVTITLKSSDIALDELVVVGYGTMKKSDLAGASVSLNEDALKGSVITNLDQSLQGRAAGVQATATSGAPGSSATIRVRGLATVNANADPLYVVDGVIWQSGGTSGSSLGLGDALGNGSVSTVSPLSSLNPADIVSMEILKDASATAIYGAQGANGVVLITTKRGQAGEPKFSYDGMIAVSQQNKRLDMLNLRDFAEFYNELVATGQADENDWYADPSLLGDGTDWQSAIFQTAIQHSHQVSVQGGTDKIKYYASANYMNQEGTIIGSNFERYSFRVNLDAQLKSWLKFGMSASYTNTAEDLKLADSNEGLVYYTLTSIPDIPIYNIDGSYATIVREGYTNPNPIALAMMDEITLNRRKLSGNIFFDVTPWEKLTWHAELGYDIGASDAERYEPMVDLGSWVRDSNYSSKQKNSSSYWSLKNYVTYTDTYNDKHDLTVMIGQEMWESNYDYTQAVGQLLPSDEVHNPVLGTGTPSLGAGFGSSSMASFFTRGNYNFDDRYLATYTYRYDASSNFGPGRRWAGFHSFAAAWRFSNEKFMKWTNGWLNNGKLRIGWGQTGNSNIGAYRWGVSITRMPTGLGMSFRPSNIANEDIQWEAQEQWNVGLDLSFLSNRINFVFDWYRKESKDMLMQMQLPMYMGTSGNASSVLQAPYGNFGNILNHGYEFTLNTRPIIGEFEWHSDLNISFNKNELKSLQGTSAGQLYGYALYGNTNLVSVSEIGKPLYQFYGYVTDGIYQDFEDLQNSPKAETYPADGTSFGSNTVWVGDQKFKDLNGDGKITEADRTIIGNPWPDFTFGWTNTFYWKNFDLSIFITGSVGNDVMNYLSIKLTDMKSAWSNYTTAINDRARLVAIDPNIGYNDIRNVRVTNLDAKLPRATVNDPNDNDRISDRYIEDGSYVRLKNISLGYTFDKKLLKKTGLESLRLYANIQNVCTITGYDGYDPEIGVNTSGNNVYGFDNGRYPSPITYSFGLNLTF